jgi:hypothetical protein
LIYSKNKSAVNENKKTTHSNITNVKPAKKPSSEPASRPSDKPKGKGKRR